VNRNEMLRFPYRQSKYVTYCAGIGRSALRFHFFVAFALYLINKKHGFDLNSTKSQKAQHFCVGSNLPV
jgi:hypothetical protein